MFLREIILKNFRNHLDVKLNFNSNVIFFLGNNGQGKTNLLEAISFFSTLRSFRSVSEKQILNWDCSHFYLQASYNFLSKSNKIEFSFLKSNQSKKQIKFNNEVLKRRTDIIGKFLTLVFSPSDLKIIEEGQIERRKFLDSFISSIDFNYLQNLVEYNKILKHRNSLLKNPSLKLNELDFWDEKIVKSGILIFYKRYEIIKILQCSFLDYIRVLSKKTDNFILEYKPNITSEENFFKKLKDNINKDLKLGYTTSGIHRDEIFIGNKKNDLTSFASQGQKRSSILALKLAAYNYYKKYQNLNPILLIDDILNELDFNRREIFLDMIFDAKQAFFTTTNLDSFEKLRHNNLEIYNIQNNEIIKN